MSTTYAAVPANVTPSGAVNVTIPADGDGLNAASVNTALQELTDYTGLLMGKGTVETTPQFPTLVAPSGATAFRLRDQINTLGGAHIRTYSYGGNDALVTTYNAEWFDDAGVMKWRRDIAGDSGMWWMGLSLIGYYYPSASASPWAFGSWSSGRIALSPVGGTIASVGDINSSAGDLSATAGNLIATGDPAADEGRCKALQFAMSGSAPTANATSETGADNGVGDATETVVAGSNDARGRITVTTGAATGNGTILIVTFNKAYPIAPEVILTPTNADTADLGWVPYVASTTTTFTIVSGGGANKLTGGGIPYGWAYHVIG